MSFGPKYTLRYQRLNSLITQTHPCPHPRVLNLRRHSYFYSRHTSSFSNLSLSLSANLRNFSSAIKARTTATLSNMAFPETIKAIVAPQHGDIDVLELVDLPFPVQKPDEVLIKVRSISAYIPHTTTSIIHTKHYP